MSESTAAIADEAYRLGWNGAMMEIERYADALGREAKQRHDATLSHAEMKSYNDIIGACVKIRDFCKSSHRE